MSDLFKILTPDFKFCDQRGELIQLVHTGYEQVNVLVSNAGVTRGGHYHKRSSEVFYVLNGSVRLTFTCGSRRAAQTFKKGDMFLIYPNVVHSMDFPEQCTMIGMYDRCVEEMNGEKDIFID